MHYTNSETLSNVTGYGASSVNNQITPERMTYLRIYDVNEKIIQ